MLPLFIEKLSQNMQNVDFKLSLKSNNKDDENIIKPNIETKQVQNNLVVNSINNQKQKEGLAAAQLSFCIVALGSVRCCSHSFQRSQHSDLHSHHLWQHQTKPLLNLHSCLLDGHVPTVTFAGASAMATRAASSAMATTTASSTKVVG